MLTPHGLPTAAWPTGRIFRARGIGGRQYVRDGREMSESQWLPANGRLVAMADIIDHHGRHITVRLSGDEIVTAISAEESGAELPLENDSTVKSTRVASA